MILYCIQSACISNLQRTSNVAEALLLLTEFSATQVKMVPLCSRLDTRIVRFEATILPSEYDVIRYVSSLLRLVPSAVYHTMEGVVMP